MAYSNYGSPLGAALAELRAQRKALDDAITALEKVMAGQQKEASGVPTLSPFPPGPMKNPFAGMTIPQAAVTLLKGGGRPLSNREMADALEKSGFKHESDNFPNTLNSVLSRAARVHRNLVRADGKWHLPEWAGKNG